MISYVCKSWWMNSTVIPVASINRTELKSATSCNRVAVAARAGEWPRRLASSTNRAAPAVLAVGATTLMNSEPNATGTSSSTLRLIPSA